MSENADGLFLEASRLRNEIQLAKIAEDHDRVVALEVDLDRVRTEARIERVDPATAGEELLALRHELRKIYRRLQGRTLAGWLGRIFIFGGVGSGDRIWTDQPPKALDRDLDERRRVVVARIYELEEHLIAVDGLGTFPLLAPDNVDRWW